MKTPVLIILLSLAACSPGPVKFSAPDKNAPVWDLNAGRSQGTNDLVHQPILGMR
jgi:predicted small lipoprotein YifL